MTEFEDDDDLPLNEDGELCCGQVLREDVAGLLCYTCGTLYPFAYDIEPDLEEEDE